MTREERKRELEQIQKSPDGERTIKEIYGRCLASKEWVAKKHGMIDGMIERILDFEFRASKKIVSQQHSSAPVPNLQPPMTPNDRQRESNISMLALIDRKIVEVEAELAKPTGVVSVEKATKTLAELRKARQDVATRLQRLSQRRDVEAKLRGE
jgi:hypothetical protein